MSEHEKLVLQTQIENMHRELRYLQKMHAGITLCVQRDRIMEVLATLRLSREEYERIVAIIERRP